MLLENEVPFFRKYCWTCSVIVYNVSLCISSYIYMSHIIKSCHQELQTGKAQYRGLLKC